MAGPKSRAVKFYSTVSDRSEVVHMISRLFSSDGGPGSGNHGHAGRPGEVGGSAPGEGGGSSKEEERKKSEAELEKVISKLSRFGREGETRRKLEEALKRLKQEGETTPSKAAPAPRQSVKFAKAPESAKTLAQFTARSEEHNKKLIDRLDFDPETLEKATKALSAVFDKNCYGMFIDSGVFLQKVMNSHFMNQFESGTSRGIFDWDTRENASQKLFQSGYIGMDSKEYEKYGCLVGNEAGVGCRNGYGYGDLVVTFKKDRLAGRVTYTLTDSLAVIANDYYDDDEDDEDEKEGENEDIMMAGSVSVEKTTLGGMPYGLAAKQITALSMTSEQDAGDLGLLQAQLHSPYIELQFHGELTPDDVDSICFRSQFDLERNLTEKQQEELKKRGIRVGYRREDSFIEV